MKDWRDARTTDGASAVDVNTNGFDCTAPQPPADPLAACLAEYHRWLHLPEKADQVVAALGAVAANLLPGDALWMLFVGSPGSGKTETIVPLKSLPYIFEVSTVNEAALLSGTPRKERAKGARGGLLNEIGEFGIILMKDFSGVLSLNPNDRGRVLSALREIYDGSWTRRVGAEGAVLLSWNGKCGVVGAVTPSIDRHHAVMAALGERFLLYRLDDVSADKQARQRLANRGHEREMREALAGAVDAVLSDVDRMAIPRPLNDDETDRLVDLSTFVCHARSAVERDGYDREVVVMPSREAPGRLVGCLGQLLAGCEAVGADVETAWRIVERAAWSCVPDLRKRLLFALRDRPGALVRDLMVATDIPKTTMTRTLEDLELLKLAVATREGTADNTPKAYQLTAETVTSWPNSDPETLDTQSTSLVNVLDDDISGSLDGDRS